VFTLLRTITLKDVAGFISQGCRIYASVHRDAFFVNGARLMRRQFRRPVSDINRNIITGVIADAIAQRWPHVPRKPFARVLLWRFDYQRSGWELRFMCN
jgi:hypothetical protein